MARQIHAEKRLLEVTTVMEIKGVSRKTVLRWIRKSGIKTALIGRKWFVKSSDLEHLNNKKAV